MIQEQPSSNNPILFPAVSRIAEQIAALSQGQNNIPTLDQSRICNLASSVKVTLDHSGTASILNPISLVDFVQLSKELGTIVDSDKVQLIPGSRSLAASPGGLPVHSDSPFISILGLYCVKSGAITVPTLVVDLHGLLGALEPGALDTAHQLKIWSGPYPGRKETRVPFVHSVGVHRKYHFQPWNIVQEEGSPTSAITSFLSQVENFCSANVRSFPLQEGQALFLNDRRMLHGRGEVSPGSDRLLFRTWMQ